MTFVFVADDGGCAESVLEVNNVLSWKSDILISECEPGTPFR